MTNRARVYARWEKNNMCVFVGVCVSMRVCARVCECAISITILTVGTHRRFFNRVGFVKINRRRHSIPTMVVTIAVSEHVATTMAVIIILSTRHGLAITISCTIAFKIATIMAIG